MLPHHAAWSTAPKRNSPTRRRRVSRTRPAGPANETTRRPVAARGSRGGSQNTPRATKELATEAPAAPDQDVEDEHARAGVDPDEEVTAVPVHGGAARDDHRHGVAE